MLPEYAERFRGLGDDELDALADSFALERCRRRERLCDIVASRMGAVALGTVPFTHRGLTLDRGLSPYTRGDARGQSPLRGRTAAWSGYRGMARKPRVEKEGGVHHVYARGNGRQSIYLDDADRASYLRMLARVVTPSAGAASPSA